MGYGSDAEAEINFLGDPDERRIMSKSTKFPEYEVQVERDGIAKGCAALVEPPPPPPLVAWIKDGMLMLEGGSLQFPLVAIENLIKKHHEMKK